MPCSRSSLLPASDILIVWRCDFASAGWDESVVLEFLDPSETARAGAFIHEADRRRFILSRWIVKKLLGCCLGTPGRRLRLLTGEHGKPYLSDPAAPSFNLSHCGEVCIVGLAVSGLVGVDVELHRDIAEVSDLADMVFSAAERDELRSLPSEAIMSGFLRGWTRKEAVVKALGLGIGVDLKAVTVGLHGENRQMVSAPELSIGPLWVRSLDAAPGEYIAVAHTAEIRRIDIRPLTAADVEVL